MQSDGLSGDPSETQGKRHESVHGEVQGSALGEVHEGRTLIAIGGTEREAFLQGLVTNDVARLSEGLVYAGLLTPQGKYLADFFLVPDGDRILLDVASPLATDLFKRLKMYKLRADVTLDEAKGHVLRGLGPAPEGAFSDPRHVDLGWRSYTMATGGPAAVDWDAIRVNNCIPETGIELRPNETFILEAGFERLHGVDFRKGCYVGQEVTARMKHKTELRKGFATVRVAGDAPAPGTEILHKGKSVGALFTVSGSRGIAYLRYGRAGEGMEAGAAKVSWSSVGAPV
ncbi:MAG: folate-binding protein [Pseudomonadota bacterium]